jgi:hypothetical protein
MSLLAMRDFYQCYEKMNLMLNHRYLICYFWNVIREVVTKIYKRFDYHIGPLGLLQVIEALLFMCLWIIF